MRAARTATGSEHEQSRISTAERHMELWGPDGSTRRTLESHCEHVAPLRATVTIMLCQVRGPHSMSVTHTIAIQFGARQAHVIIWRGALWPGFVQAPSRAPHHWAAL